MKFHRSLNSLEKEHNWRILTSQFQTYYKFTVIKTVWYWYKDIQNNELETSEINSHIHGQVIFNKGPKTIQRKKDSFFNNWSQGNWKSTCKRMKLSFHFTPYTKINPRWIKDLNVGSETVKLSEDNIGNSFIAVVLAVISWYDTKIKCNKN